MRAQAFRAFARTPCRLAAALHRPGGAAAEAVVVDVGLGGAAVEVAEAPELGERLQLELGAALLWSPLRLTARVAWAGAGPGGLRAGLAFEPPDRDHLAALLALLRAVGPG